MPWTGMIWRVPFWSFKGLWMLAGEATDASSRPYFCISSYIFWANIFLCLSLSSSYSVIIGYDAAGVLRWYCMAGLWFFCLSRLCEVCVFVAPVDICWKFCHARTWLIISFYSLSLIAYSSSSSPSSAPAILSSINVSWGYLSKWISSDSSPRRSS